MVGHIPGEMLQDVGVTAAGWGAAHHFGKGVEIAPRQGLIIGEALGVGQQAAKTLAANLTVRYQDDKGVQQTATDHFATPPDLANGIVPKLLMNARPDAMPQSFSLMAATPTPRMVKLLITPAGPERFTVGGSPREAMHYVPVSYTHLTLPTN